MKTRRIYVLVVFLLLAGMVFALQGNPERDYGCGIHSNVVKERNTEGKVSESFFEDKQIYGSHSLPPGKALSYWVDLESIPEHYGWKLEGDTAGVKMTVFGTRVKLRNDRAGGTGGELRLWLNLIDGKGISTDSIVTYISMWERPLVFTVEESVGEDTSSEIYRTISIYDKNHRTLNDCHLFINGNYITTGTAKYNQSTGQIPTEPHFTNSCGGIQFRNYRIERDDNPFCQIEIRTLNLDSPRDEVYAYEESFEDDKPEPVEPEPEPPVVPDTIPAIPDINTENYVRESVVLDPDSNWVSIIQRYYDGVGRMIETVARDITPFHQDLVTYREYNGIDLIRKEWLAYPMEESSGFHPHGDGKVARDFYADSRPYAETLYESSPTQRPVIVYAEGDAWREHPLTKSYLLNRDTDELRCRRYSMEGDSLMNKGFYQPGQLQVEKTEDEDGKRTYIFKDASGRTVLERIADEEMYFDTYYVYDNLDNLSYVLPPLAWSDLSHENLTRYAYRFEYDKWKHCVKKQLPGGSMTEYAFDYADRLIFSQDAVQRNQSEATFCFYDIFGREAVKGICRMDTVPLLAEQVGSVIRTDGGDMQSGYIFPMRLEVKKLVSVSYYDNYDFLNLEVLQEAKKDLADSEEEGFVSRYVSKLLPEISAKGKLTGRCIFAADMLSSYLQCSAFYYDNKHRMVQSRKHDSRGYTDLHFYRHSFTGKSLCHLHRHIAMERDTIEETYTYSYDHAERLARVKYRINDAPECNLTANQYDELCRLKQVKVGAGTHLIDYTYNIRGWLTNIDSEAFSQTLQYQDNANGNIPCYNGNVSGMAWRTGIDAQVKRYNFSYDSLNRLTKADYVDNNKFSTAYSYDKMGNILNLQRYGQTSATEHGLIDNLNLKYDGNRLQSVYDNATHSAYGNGMDFKDGANLETEYFYNANGNMTKDLNKKIVDIQYNFLNLPRRIEFEDGNLISYLYDAEGMKLRTTHVIGNDSVVTDYCNNVIYENGVAKALLAEVGYASLADSKFYYYLKDHLGNNRVVINESGKVEEINDYYPFGGLMTSPMNSIQLYKYNGKELNRKNGLDWYDYGARYYEPVLGRFMTVDPMAEKYYEWSLYAYCLNNPMKYIDPDGKVSQYPPGGSTRVHMGFTNWSPEKTARIGAIAQSANAIGKQVFAGSSITLSGSVKTVGGGFSLGSVGAKAEVGIGNLSVSTNGAELTTTASLFKGEYSAAVGSAALKTEATLGEAEGVIGGVNEGIGTTAFSASSKIQVGDNTNAGLDIGGNISAGVKAGPVEVNFSVNLRTAGEWILGALQTITKMFSPEIIIRVEDKR